MKLDNCSKSGITNHQVDEAIRMWDNGNGMNLTDIGTHFGRSAHAFRYQFKKRGIIVSRKSKKTLDRKAA